MIKIKIEGNNKKELENATEEIKKKMPLGIETELEVEVEVVNVKPNEGYDSYDRGYSTRFVNKILAISENGKGITMAGWNSKEELENDNVK